MRSKRQILEREWSRMNAQDRALSKTIHQFDHNGTFFSLCVMVKRAVDAYEAAGKGAK